MLGRLLDLRATIAAARRASAKASAELELGITDENRVLAEAAQWRASASAMLVRIGELQAAGSTALLAARTRYLRRRSECQCDELRYAGASAAQLAACMRHCAGESELGRALWFVSLLLLSPWLTHVMQIRLSLRVQCCSS
jgi:hypothetical protein